MKGLLLKYGLPILIIVVAFIQFYQVYFNNLSRWKGGGFGMYSEMHPQTREVWIRTSDSCWQILYRKKKLSHLERDASNLIYHPSEKNLNNFLKKIKKNTKSQNLSIEIWQPELLPGTQTLTKKLIANASLSE